MAAVGNLSVNSALHDFPTDRINLKALLCMLKLCIRNAVIDLSPTPTPTVDDAVPTGLNPCQQKRWLQRMLVEGRRKKKGAMGKKNTLRNEGMGRKQEEADEWVTSALLLLRQKKKKKLHLKFFVQRWTCMLERSSAALIFWEG